MVFIDVKQGVVLFMNIYIYVYMYLVRKNLLGSQGLLHVK